jgi:asparagine synthetase B (glutamine-hydrolysing)
MCGICGEIDFNRGVKVEPIQRMCRVLAHRGPDDEGMVFIKGNECFEMKGPSQSPLKQAGFQVGLGHRRLHHRSFGGCSSTHDE